MLIKSYQSFVTVAVALLGRVQSAPLTLYALASHNYPVSVLIFM